MPAFAIAYPILFAVLMTFATTVISVGLQMVFTKKQKNPVSGGENRTITVRQPVSPWKTIYGSARVGGTIFFLERDGVDVWLGVVWAAHECKAIDSVYTDDTQNFVTSVGGIDGTNSGKLFVYNHLGDPDQTYDTTVAAAFPLLWTSDHRLRGRCYSFFRFVNLATNWESNIPNVSADIRGRLIVDTRTGNEVFTDNGVQCIQDFLKNGDFGFATEASEIDTANYNAESNICDEEVAIPEWSEHFVLDGAIVDFALAAGPPTTNLGLLSGLDNQFGSNGSPVFVTTTGTLPVPLVAGTTYYVGTVTGAGNNLTLHPTAADGVAGTNAIICTTAGVGTHTMVDGDMQFTMLGKETTFTANTGTDQITFADSLLAGTYLAVFESTITLPAPFVAGTKYQITVGTATLASGVALDTDGSAVNITTVGSGVHTARLIAQHAQADSADPSTDQFTVISTDLLPRTVGRAVTLNARTATPPDPLSTGTGYFVALADSLSKLRLGETRSQAEAGKWIDLKSTDVGTWGLNATEMPQDEILGATTGMVVQVETRGGGVLPTGLSTSTDYYFIRRGRGIFQLASTRQNALDGIAINVTDAGTETTHTYKVTLKRERRFTVNGPFDSDQDKRDILKGMANAIGMGAILEPLGTGRWRVKCGTYRLPTGSLGLGQVRSGGTPEVQTRIARQSASNTVKGVYNSPLNFDQASDFPACSDPRFVAEDDGEELVEDITLPFTNSKTTARRIATSWLKRKRLQRTIRWPATLAAGFRHEYGDATVVTLPLLGYSNRVFQVQGWEMTTETEGDGPPIPRVDLILREANPQAFQ